MRNSNTTGNTVKKVAAPTAKRKMKTVSKRGPGRPKGSPNKVARPTIDSKLSEAVKLTETIIKNWDKPNSSAKVLAAHNQRAELLNDKRVAKKWQQFYNLNLGI